MERSWWRELMGNGTTPFIFKEVMEYKSRLLDNARDVQKLDSTVYK
jgi:hypothetical protein